MPGHNADRHLCKTCRFRAAEAVGGRCDYILCKRRRRGCKAEDCNKYEPGKRFNRIKSLDNF